MLRTCPRDTGCPCLDFVLARVSQGQVLIGVATNGISHMRPHASYIQNTCPLSLWGHEDNIPPASGTGARGARLAKSLWAFERGRGDSSQLEAIRLSRSREPKLETRGSTRPSSQLHMYRSRLGLTIG